MRKRFSSTFKEKFNNMKRGKPSVVIENVAEDEYADSPKSRHVKINMPPIENETNCLLLVETNQEKSSQNKVIFRNDSFSETKLSDNLNL
jgi:hypothetical protein